MRSERAQLASKRFKRSRAKLRKLKGKHPARDQKYKAFIRALSCLLCAREQGLYVDKFAAMGLPYIVSQPSITEAAHMGPHGISQKASDYTCLPLCGWHHREAPDSAHKLGRAFLQHHGIDFETLTTALFAAFREVRS